MAHGLGPTFLMVLFTSPECASRIDTSPEEKLATTTCLPSGVTAQPNGSVPTLMVLCTSRLRASMTETVPLRRLVTKTRLSFAAMATLVGSSPTSISSIFLLASPPTSMTETELLSGFTTQTKRSSLVSAIGPEEVGGSLCARTADRPMQSAARQSGNLEISAHWGRKRDVEIRRELEFIMGPSLL